MSYFSHSVGPHHEASQPWAHGGAGSSSRFTLHTLDYVLRTEPMTWTVFVGSFCRDECYISTPGLDCMYWSMLFETKHVNQGSVISLVNWGLKTLDLKRGTERVPKCSTKCTGWWEIRGRARMVVENNICAMHSSVPLPGGSSVFNVNSPDAGTAIREHRTRNREGSAPYYLKLGRLQSIVQVC